MSAYCKTKYMKSLIKQNEENASQNPNKTKHYKTDMNIQIALHT